ncbi:hypothetical protein BC827DRAFT_1156547 [Russula dissimulans]|nr:hypothetical protein BC827DRAFT_1156547 [Russula dissimulans]
MTPPLHLLACVVGGIILCVFRSAIGGEVFALLANLALLADEFLGWYKSIIEWGCRSPRSRAHQKRTQAEAQLPDPRKVIIETKKRDGGGSDPKKNIASAFRSRRSRHHIGSAVHRFSRQRVQYESVASSCGCQWAQ